MREDWTPRMVTTNDSIKTDLRLSLAERTQAIDARAIETVLIQGDLSKLQPGERVAYYNRMCETLGLNPLTKPFAYLTLNGKLILYALKDATEQLRKLHSVSIVEITSARLEDVFVVTVKASDKTGRTDAATGAVAIGNLKGENLANALMKAETKAKRRVTLSICGLGMLDETEVESIPQAGPFVEATHRIELPPGTVQILSATVTSWGGEVTSVSSDGVEMVHKTAERRCAEIAEAIAQEHVPATLTLEPITKGKNAGQLKLTEVHRYGIAIAPAAPEAPLTANDIPF